MGNSKNDNNNRKIVVKSGSDDMRAFFDFCMDFMADEALGKGFNPLDEFGGLCEDPELIRLVMLDIKYNRKRLKP